MDLLTIITQVESGCNQWSQPVIDEFLIQVKRNCDISDAKFCGTFSMCGLLLMLRNLYKWEHHLPPWEEPDRGAIMAWVEEREEQWLSLSEQNFEKPVLNGMAFDPFDVTGINLVLQPQGLVYAAGYSGGLKPSFLVAELEDHFFLEGRQIFVLARELARDILIFPAMSRDGTIYGRKETLSYLLWDLIQEKWSTQKPAVFTALEDSGISLPEHDRPISLMAGLLRPRLPGLVAQEMDAYFRHELGELTDNSFDRDIWRQIISENPQTNLEKLARGIKDLLADTSDQGRLNYIITQQKKGSLGFYVAFIFGFPKMIFREIFAAYTQFRETNDWTIIERARKIGHTRAADLAAQLTDLFHQAKLQEPAWIHQQIDRLVSPLFACAGK
ncbi:MAG: hypothetical protein HQK60_03155 [Deltaproteobacteria bacterium]|nr:hypothetical protein [Deltaproteobacteria bacterium]